LVVVSTQGIPKSAEEPEKWEGVTSYPKDFVKYFDKNVEKFVEFETSGTP
jgi:hypothetical protein